MTVKGSLYSAGGPVKELSNFGYEVMGVLGEGTYGTVLKAMHLMSQRLVAVKVILKNKLEKGELKKVQLEVQAMKRLNHPNIVEMRDYRETSGYMYLILEYCSKGDLLEYVQSKERLSEHEALVLFRQLLNGMEHAHNNGIIHRDIKLENLLLAQDGTLKIADWGFARGWAWNSQITEYPGSLHYASPEIVLATPYVGPEVDVWSMGVTLYAFCSGCMPFFGQSDDLIVDRIKTSNFPMCHTFTKDLRDLLTRMLDPDSKTRYGIENIKNHPWVSCRVTMNGISRIRSRSFVIINHGKPEVPTLNLNGCSEINKITADTNIVVTPKGVVTHRSFLFDENLSNSHSSSSNNSNVSSDGEVFPTDSEDDAIRTNRKQQSNNGDNNACAPTTRRTSPKENPTSPCPSPPNKPASPHSPSQQRKGMKKMLMWAPLLKWIGKGSPRKDSNSPPTTPDAKKKRKEVNYLKVNNEVYSSPYI